MRYSGVLLPRPLFRLAWAVAALAALTSAVGLVHHGVYRDPESSIEAGWWGNDLVTLVLAVPVLAWSAWKAPRGPGPATLVCLGALTFMVYNFAFYLFGAAPNRLLLAYIALVALSLVALMMGLVNLQPPGQELEKPTRRFLVAYMAAWAVSLGLLWTIQAALFAWHGQAPDLNGSAHAFRVTAALDLTLVVPFVALATVLLIRRNAWGWPLAAILNVKGVLYPAVLMASSVSASMAGVEAPWRSCRSGERSLSHRARLAGCCCGRRRSRIDAHGRTCGRHRGRDLGARGGWAGGGALGPRAGPSWPSVRPGIANA